MPKRILHGEGMWGSDKIRQVQPPEFRVEYAWLYSYAHSNGAFQYDAHAIWVQCYALLRPEFDPAKVEALFAEFQRVKLAFIWEQDGKSYCYWVGSEKLGRLPRRSWRERERKNGTLPPDPPPAALEAFLSEGLKQDAWLKRARNTPEACKEHAQGVPGIGIGAGNGNGIGHTRRAAPSVTVFPRRLFEIYNEERGSLPEAKVFTSERERKCLARLKDQAGKEQKFLSDFQSAVRIAARTPFLCGDGDRGWCADFDWLVKNGTNYARILEGSYKGISRNRNEKGGSRVSDRTRRNLENARRL